MIRSIAIAVAAAIAVTPLLSAAQNYPGVPTDLAAAAIAFDRAQVKGDAAALRALLADDYLLINSQDQRQTKAQFIADTTAPGFTMDPFTIDDQVIKVWHDGAVLSGVATLKGMSDGKPYSVRLRFSDVWAKRSGKWRVIYAHASRIATKP